MRWSWLSSPDDISISLMVPVKAVSPGGVVVWHRGEGVAADVGVLIPEGDPFGLLDPALTDRPAVQVEGDGAALGEPAAVVGELHPHLMLARRDRLLGADDELLEAEQVVAEGRPAVFEVERPAT